MGTSAGIQLHTMHPEAHCVRWWWAQVEWWIYGFLTSLVSCWGKFEKTAACSPSGTAFCMTAMSGSRWRIAEGCTISVISLQNWSCPNAAWKGAVPQLYGWELSEKETQEWKQPHETVRRFRVLVFRPHGHLELLSIMLGQLTFFDCQCELRGLLGKWQAPQASSSVE